MWCKQSWVPYSHYWGRPHVSVKGVYGAHWSVLTLTCDLDAKGAKGGKGIDSREREGRKEIFLNK